MSAGPTLPNVTLTGRILDSADRALASADRAAREMASLCIMGSLGCAIGGGKDAFVNVLIADGLPNGGSGDAPPIRRGERVTMRDAVLINGAAGHALDYDAARFP